MSPEEVAAVVAKVLTKHLNDGSEIWLSEVPDRLAIHIVRPDGQRFVLVTAQD